MFIRRQREELFESRCMPYPLRFCACNTRPYTYRFSSNYSLHWSSLASWPRRLPAVNREKIPISMQVKSWKNKRKLHRFNVLLRCGKWRTRVIKNGRGLCEPFSAKACVLFQSIAFDCNAYDVSMRQKQSHCNVYMHAKPINSAWKKFRFKLSWTLTLETSRINPSSRILIFKKAGEIHDNIRGFIR